MDSILRQQMPSSLPTSNRPKSRNPWLVIAVIIFIATLGAAGYFFWQYHRSRTQLAELISNPGQVAAAEKADLIAKVGKLVALPEGEDPTIATVTEPEKLKDQDFFAKAQIGDKVLIYTKAKKAFLYNPGSNKIIEIAPVTIGGGTETPTPKK